jgi:hypothetical protein
MEEINGLNALFFVIQKLFFAKKLHLVFFDKGGGTRKTVSFECVTMTKERNILRGA